MEIPDSVFAKMQGASFQENPHIKREELAYLKIPYYGFDKAVHEGIMVVHRKIASAVQEIFAELCRAQYPIERMEPAENFGGDDNRMMAANNTSGFNYRTIAGTNRISKHGLGLAVDVNPLYNPYIRWEKGKRVCEPIAGDRYSDRTKTFPHKISQNDLCYILFKRYGFEWGGEWERVKDYHHFEYKN